MANINFNAEEMGGDEMQPIQINNSVITPLTKPIDFNKFLDAYNKGEEIEMEPVGEKGSYVGYVEWFDKGSNRTVVLTVWAGADIDETKPMAAQICKDDKNRKIVFLRNRSDRAKKFGKQ